MPCVRAVATKRARPAAASHAEKARRSMGAAEYPVAPSWRAQTESAMKRDNIIPSKHSRAESRWVR